MPVGPDEVFKDVTREFNEISLSFTRNEPYCDECETGYPFQSLHLISRLKRQVGVLAGRVAALL